MESAGWSLPRSRIPRFPPRCAQSGGDLPTGKAHCGGPSRHSSLSTNEIGSIAFPQTSVPAGYGRGGPGASLSHLIASLHPDRPPSSSQKTAKILQLQIPTRKGSGCSLMGGTATVCRALPTGASSALSPSDHSNSLRCLLHTQKPKADPGCHPLPPPSRMPGSVQSHPLGHTPLTLLRGNPVLPSAAQVGYHLRQPRSARWSFPKFCYQAISPACI